MVCFGEYKRSLNPERGEFERRGSSRRVRGCDMAFLAGSGAALRGPWRGPACRGGVAASRRRPPRHARQPSITRARHFPSFTVIYGAAPSLIGIYGRVGRRKGEAQGRGRGPMRVPAAVRAVRRWRGSGSPGARAARAGSGALHAAANITPPDWKERHVC